ncbi:unnamed protein product, partial [Symbiodinium necroappetens]
IFEEPRKATEIFAMAFQGYERWTTLLPFRAVMDQFMDALDEDFRLRGETNFSELLPILAADLACKTGVGRDFGLLPARNQVVVKQAREVLLEDPWEKLIELLDSITGEGATVFDKLRKMGAALSWAFCQLACLPELQEELAAQIWLHYRYIMNNSPEMKRKLGEGIVKHPPFDSLGTVRAVAFAGHQWRSPRDVLIFPAEDVVIRLSCGAFDKLFLLDEERGSLGPMAGMSRCGEAAPERVSIAWEEAVSARSRARQGGSPLSVMNELDGLAKFARLPSMGVKNLAGRVASLGQKRPLDEEAEESQSIYAGDDVQDVGKAEVALLGVLGDAQSKAKPTRPPGQPAPAAGEAGDPSTDIRLREAKRLEALSRRLDQRRAQTRRVQLL